MANRPAKIGIDARLWNETGIGRYIRNLVQRLDAKEFAGSKYIIFLLKKDYDAVSFKEPHMEKRLLDVKWHTLQEQILVPNILTREKLDLMHFPYFSVPMFYKKPFVVTIHDLIIDHFSTGKASSLPFVAYQTKRFGYRTVLQNAIKKSEHILTPSCATKKEILDHYRAQAVKVSVTQEGIDHELTQAKVKSSSRKDDYFLYVGNVYPHKNAENLVDAFAKFSTIDSQMKLKLVGREDYFYRRLKKYILAQNIQNVEFTGFVNDQELAGLYQGARALVAPSLMEGFGLTVLEAMSMGISIACSDIPAFTEVCGTVPLYFQPTNVQDIADTMTRMVEMSLPERKKRAELGLSQAKKFSWNKMVCETVKVYESSTRIR